MNEWCSVCDGEHYCVEYNPNISEPGRSMGTSWKVRVQAYMCRKQVESLRSKLLRDSIEKSYWRTTLCLDVL